MPTHRGHVSDSVSYGREDCICLYIFSRGVRLHEGGGRDKCCKTAYKPEGVRDSQQEKIHHASVAKRPYKAPPERSNHPSGLGASGKSKQKSWSEFFRYLRSPGHEEGDGPGSLFIRIPDV